MLARWLSVLPPLAYERLLEKIDEAVLVIDSKGRVLDLNPAGDRLLRRLARDQPPTFVGSSLEATLGPGPWPAPGPASDLAPRAVRDTDFTLSDVAGSGIDLQLRLSPLNDSGEGGRRIGWALVARDVTDLNCQRTELERINDRLHEQLHTIELLRADLAAQAIHDHLTGLHNRRHLMSELAAAVQYASAVRSELSVALLDLDRFREINNRYGPEFADGVLERVATMLSGAALPGEVVARHGGQEFALVLPGVAAPEAAAYVDALRKLIRSSDLLVEGLPVRATFSAGVAAFTGGEDPAELLQAADEALYAAKQRGRDRVQLAAAALARPGVARLPR